MNKSASSIILNHLLQDLTIFSFLALAFGVFFAFFLAGAKLLELKQMDRWPALFAILPFFWLIAGIFDPQPNKARELTKKMSIIFGILSLGVIVLAIRIL